MDTSLSLSMTKKDIQSNKTSQYDKNSSLWQHLVICPTQQHFFKKPKLSLIAKNKRLLLVIASRLNGKAKHEKALKNDIWISIFDRKRFKVPKNAKGHYTTQKLMNGNKSTVKFKLSFWLAQNEILTNLKFVDTTRKQACALLFYTYNPRRLAKKFLKKLFYLPSLQTL